MDESFDEIRERKMKEFEEKEASGEVIDDSKVWPWWVTALCQRNKRIKSLSSCCNWLVDELIDSEEQIMEYQKRIEELERYTGQC